MSDLSPAEYAAIRDYALERGRKWKADLALDWYYARRPGHLQAIRNRLGPVWLDKFKLPRDFWTMNERTQKTTPAVFRRSVK
jgi:hypothetical protein